MKTGKWIAGLLTILLLTMSMNNASAHGWHKRAHCRHARVIVVPHVFVPRVVMRPHVRVMRSHHCMGGMQVRHIYRHRRWR